MIGFARRIAPGGVVSIALVLGACAHTPKPVASPPPPLPVAETQNEVDEILLLLDQGDERTARKRIDAAIKRNPANPALQVLRDSIDRDPKELLGPTSFAYVTRAGDTMTGLAERFLGNRLKAYQLARYNGIDKPADLAAGQTLRIPGEPPRPAQTRPEPRGGAASPARVRPSAGKPTPAKTPLPVANPAAARQARAAGLAALNSGNVAGALGLLRRAGALDPGNPLIVRDLARAERIAATLRGRK